LRLLAFLFGLLQKLTLASSLSQDLSITEVVTGRRTMAHIGMAGRGVDHTGGMGPIGAGVIGMVVTGTVITGMPAGRAVTGMVITGMAVGIIELI
jgi:hypothetical protein